MWLPHPPTCISEEKGRIIDWNNAGASPFGMLSLFEKVNKGSAHFVRSPLLIGAHPDLQSLASAAHSPQRPDACAIETDLHLFLEKAMCYPRAVAQII